ncbi:PIN domain-containing protein [Candidatus Venteria ishoeyi]|uniref:type II toxin-antitoxin system VapC family toxin n=1 Tax=Candidatus Venteria ishoeyi TaxID=1899563 RepID=UPI0025A5BE98|nr:PIN domain-containing protein [Candidatus Venteria ishoeyi]MDM8546381.1 PIN domain-containing protein [Candidatus Venteria ishoeyi]
MKNTNATWVDTGFLVALFAQDDPFHDSATEYLQSLAHIKLYSILPVVVEACFFLDTRGKSDLLRWIERGAMTLYEVTVDDLPAIRAILEKYSNLEPDFTDAALVALAGKYDITKILTVDQRDFSVYRLPKGRQFERLWV